MPENQVILITGSNSGFGNLMSRTFLEKGYTVFASMRNLTGKNSAAAEELKTSTADMPGKLHLIELDVVDGKSVQKAVAEVLHLESRIDVVINNAGYGLGGLAESVTDEQLLHQFDVNVFGVHRVMRAVLPAMHQQKAGLIINVSSIVGRVVIPFSTVYTASKFALEGLTESYRYELNGRGIDVVLVEPGGYGTNFIANRISGNDTDRLSAYDDLAERSDRMRTDFKKHIFSDNAPKPRDVADTVLKLAETPAGQRPFRTVVASPESAQGPVAINKLCEDVQKKMLTAWDMADLLSVNTTP
ncbi:MAG: SDR family oxidoreductase [Desulfobacteraceae bacterium]|nr:SDR family oxidoreductase [Desulfobacteraceae bacterium]